MLLGLEGTAIGLVQCTNPSSIVQSIRDPTPRRAHGWVVWIFEGPKFRKFAPARIFRAFPFAPKSDKFRAFGARHCIFLSRAPPRASGGGMDKSAWGAWRRLRWGRRRRRWQTQRRARRHGRRGGRKLVVGPPGRRARSHTWGRFRTFASPQKFRCVNAISHIRSEIGRILLTPHP